MDKTVFGRARGFTLIELVVVIAIVGILSAIAIPAYQDYILRASLTEATNSLSDGRVRMEQYFADNRSYAGGGGGCGAAMPAADRFNVACAVTNAGQGYTITATGIAGNNTSGFAYSIDQANTRVTVSFGSNWGAVPANGATRWLIKRP